MAEETPNPAKPSSDYEMMQPYWMMVQAIMGGVEALRAAGETYLPRHEKESAESYELRRKYARLTNVYAKTISDLSLRPFTHAITIDDSTTDALQELATDVSMRNMPLDDYAAALFAAALNDGMAGTLVDQPSGVPSLISVADERARNIRPFWRHYGALDIIAAYSDYQGGKERLVEVRLMEQEVVRMGFKEDMARFVRVLRLDEAGQPEWERWREVKQDQNRRSEWVLDTPPQKLELEAIPFVFTWFGKRCGNGFAVEPPLRDAAHLQIELYQEENNLKNISHLTAFPMLAANGMEPLIGRDGQPERATIGPKTVLYGGRTPGQEGGGSWEFVEPAGTSLNFLEKCIEKTKKDILELGREPLKTPAAGVTTIEAASDTQSSNNAVAAWVVKLEASIQQAMEISAEWLNEPGAVWKATIFKDFQIGLGDTDMATLIDMAKEKAISKSALVDEAIRRGILADNFDKEADLVLLVEEIEDAMGRMPDMGDGENEPDDGGNDASQDA